MSPILHARASIAFFVQGTACYDSQDLVPGYGLCWSVTFGRKCCGIHRDAVGRVFLCLQNDERLRYQY